MFDDDFSTLGNFDFRSVFRCLILDLPVITKQLCVSVITGRSKMKGETLQWSKLFEKRSEPIFIFLQNTEFVLIRLLYDQKIGLVLCYCGFKCFFSWDFSVKFFMVGEYYNGWVWGKCGRAGQIVCRRPQQFWWRSPPDIGGLYSNPFVFSPQMKFSVGILSLP